jgi:hypothetical protein
MLFAGGRYFAIRVTGSHEWAGNMDIIYARRGE